MAMPRAICACARAAIRAERVTPACCDAICCCLRFIYCDAAYVFHAIHAANTQASLAAAAFDASDADAERRAKRR